ncbi:MAG: hypothetical protein V7K60_32840 [Nostoc sp.]
MNRHLYNNQFCDLEFSSQNLDQTVLPCLFICHETELFYLKIRLQMLAKSLLDQPLCYLACL